MIRLLIFSFLVCCLQVLSYGQENTQGAGKSNPPGIITPENEVLMLKEAEFDFGKIPQGKPVTHIFEVSNVGSTPLKIPNVQASCGCTTPEWERDKDIAPGGTGRITVGYNAASEGTFTKFITISYGDSKTKQLTIKGEVWKTPSASAPENKVLDDLKNK
jgi:hypothetical protein